MNASDKIAVIRLIKKAARTCGYKVYANKSATSTREFDIRGRHHVQDYMFKFNSADYLQVHVATKSKGVAGVTYVYAPAFQSIRTLSEAFIFAGKLCSEVQLAARR